MASSDLILRLITIYFDTRRSAEVKDRDFAAVVRAYAADEGRTGHSKLSNRILQELAYGIKTKNQSGVLIPTSANGLVENMPIKQTRSNWVVSESLDEALDRVCQEWRYRDKLMAHGVNPSHKLLFYGEPGTGKSMTSSVLADCLNLPLFRVCEGVIEGLLGKSQTNIAHVFKMINSVPGVYLFDEFDSIGMGRATVQQEHSELRRTLNTFLQYLEQVDSQSVVICATNMVDSLDKALFRRFDLQWEFELPNANNRKRLLKLLTGIDIDDDLVIQTTGFSQAELTRWTQHAIRESLINEIPLDNAMLCTVLNRFNRYNPT